MASLTSHDQEITAHATKEDGKTEEVVKVNEMSKDEHLLATLGYRQVFIRSFGLFENWAATFVRSFQVNMSPDRETFAN